jgi:hypothetical protein
MAAKSNRTKQPTAIPSAEGRGPQYFLVAFSVIFGLFLGLCLLKFGNPPIMEKYVTQPTDIYELIFGYPWPIAWAYRLLAFVALLGIASGLALRKQALERRRTAGRPSAADKARPAPKWLIALPAVWLLWEIIAGTKSVDLHLTNPTLTHFTACVACFYLGLFCLGRVTNLWPFWLGLLAAFLLVLAEGWEQHFGGLEQSRRYFFSEVYPGMKEIPPEYLKKITSDRIFSTMFYPNALAGALLLLLPPTLGLLLTCRRFTMAARYFLAAVIGLAALLCLYWSGSKGGWLLTLLLGIASFLKFPVRQQVKVALISAILVLGLAGFFARYLGFFQKGATSVSARFDYWRAAIQTTREHPLFGTGPGTFSIAYQKLKRPESEMSRLAHNDYLQQACDSGVPAFLAYTAFVVGCMVWSLRHGRVGGDWRVFSLWLGVLGWSLQSTVEFGLYLPALVWPAFTFLGFLLATHKVAAEQAITLSEAEITQKQSKTGRFLPQN